MRARELGVKIGVLQPGPENAITDVAGVRVGHSTVVRGEGPLVVGEGPVRTGVTVVCPREGLARDEPVFAGTHRFNGNGEMTGLEWVRESGMLATPVAITNTHSVGVVRDALVAAELEARTDDDEHWCMPVVAETYDGTLNDIDGQHVTPAHVREALADAEGSPGGPVTEGSVGGGTGMICHEFKGGIGTASRRLPEEDGGWTVGALVQANYGRRAMLRVDGAPVGRVLDHDRVPTPYAEEDTAPAGTGSIIVVLATDAPLLPTGCDRLVKRAGIGLGRMGGGLDDGSGDIFLAFATGNRGLPRDSAARPDLTVPVRTVPAARMSPLFHAAAEATEEAILNALLAAGTMTGRDGITAHGLTPDLLIGALDEARALCGR